MKSKASFSRCGQYRYTLTRIWDESKKKVYLIGLNPSTADKEFDDPTIRRCIGLCAGWGYGGFEIMNLFAYRTPDPSHLKKADHPVGKRNDSYIRRAVSQDNDLILMWGNHGNYLERDNAVCRLIGDKSCWCAGVTATGAPKHFLYLRGDTRLQPYEKSVYA